MNIVHVGCSYSRGYYGDKKLDPNDMQLNLVDILANKHREHNFYNFSFYVSSIETQAVMIKHLLQKKQKIDAIIWQVTTPTRLGFIKDTKNFFKKVSYENCRATTVPNALSLLQNSCHMGFDPWYGTCFLNAGIIKDINVNWQTKTYTNMMKYAVNSVGSVYATESSMANILYTKTLVEKQSIPILIFPWLSHFKKVNTLDCFDFIVEDEIDFTNTWHDKGHHFGPKGLEKVSELILPFVQKI